MTLTEVKCANLVAVQMLPFKAEPTTDQHSCGCLCRSYQSAGTSMTMMLICKFHNVLQSLEQAPELGVPEAQTQQSASA